MLTDDELHVSDVLCEAINAYFALPQIHPNDQSDFAYLAHRMQDMIMARSAQHAHPDKFPNKMPKSVATEGFDVQFIACHLHVDDHAAEMSSAAQYYGPSVIDFIEKGG